jgi:hypothetical protein
MRALLVIAAAATAALAIPVSPAAGSDRDRAFTGNPTAKANPGFENGFRHDRRRLRGTDTILVYDREYQGDSAWKSDSFNDWWHDRRDRSYPAWMARNRDCQRMWWDGSVLRC